MLEKKNDLGIPTQTEWVGLNKTIFCSSGYDHLCDLRRMTIFAMFGILTILFTEFGLLYYLRSMIEA